MLNNSTQRNFGLDVIRSFAILMVLIGHLIPDNTINKSLFSMAMIFRGFGVELFFVLSGFLIGKILIHLLNKGLNVSNIKNFYIRRWLRTLPLYYLVFAIYIIIYKFTNPPINIFPDFFLLKQLFFIQNFDIRHMHFFNQSWSLSVEEWFYLLMPMLLVMFCNNKTKLEHLYKNLIKIIIFIALIRFFYVLGFNPADSDFGIRRCIPLRFDALLTGVLFACLKINNKEIFNKLLNKKFLIISFIILVLIIIDFYCLYFIKNPFNNLLNLVFYKSFYFTIIPFSFAFLIIFFENNEFINKKLSKILPIKYFFEKTSLYSYSMYLFNLLIMFVFDVLFVNFYHSPILISMYFISLYLISAFVYRYYEKPIMKFRDKF